MSKILNLPNRNQPFQIKAKSSTKAEIILYGAIGASWYEDSISAKQFSDEMNKLDSSVKEISLRINSPGGDVFDGITIYNRLKQHPARVTAYIDGISASIASIIMLAADEIVMGEGSLILVHLPWTMAAGNRTDFDNTIMRLMDIEEQMISIYAKKTKKSRADIRQMLEAETWLDASQAKEEGFIDTVMSETMPIAASILDKSKWINKMPKNIVTDKSQADKTITELKSKIEGFMKARK